MMRLICIVLLLCCVLNINAQQDSEFKPNGQFYVRLNKAQIELLPGMYRSRQGGLSSKFGLSNFNMTTLIHFPFSYVLRYYDRKEDIMVVDFVGFIHLTKNFNNGVGIASRFKFLIHKNYFFSYQLGLGWFGVSTPDATDGLAEKGINFHHVFSISRKINDMFDISLNWIHISNGHVFGETANNQDVIALGTNIQF